MRPGALATRTPRRFGHKDHKAHEGRSTAGLRSRPPRVECSAERQAIMNLHGLSFGTALDAGPPTAARRTVSATQSSEKCIRTDFVIFVSFVAKTVFGSFEAETVFVLVVAQAASDARGGDGCDDERSRAVHTRQDVLRQI